MSKPLVMGIVLALFVPIACAKPTPKAASNPAAPVEPVASAPSAAPAAPKVVSVVGTKNAFWSPWTFPDLASLPAPLPLPSVFPWPLPLPSATTAPPAATPTATPKPTPTAAPPVKKKPTVVLYGADWCPHCKTAKAHIESRGIAYVYRNVDDPAANSELATKLKAAKQSSGGIPTTDIEGDLLVGWSQGQFDAMYDAKAK